MRVYSWLGLILCVVCLGYVGNASAGVFDELPGYVYPFADSTSAFSPQAQSPEYDTYAQLVFNNGWFVSGSIENGVSVVKARRSEGLVNTSWLVRRQDSDVWQSLNNYIFRRPASDYDVFEVSVSDSSDSSLSFYVAWPIDHAVADHYLPVGSVNGEIVWNGRSPSLHAWGNLHDALQVERTGSAHGINKAALVVDGTLYYVIPHFQTGDFEMTVPVKRKRRGLHAVALYAIDKPDRHPRRLDCDYVSEYNILLSHAPLPDPTTWWWSGSNGSGSWSGSSSVNVSGGWSNLYYPDGIAVAKPILDYNGYLKFDGRDSIDAHFYRWTIENLASGETWSESGSRIGTADLPEGFYQISLDCRGDNPTYNSDDEYPNGGNPAIDSFYVLIPPRIDMSCRKVCGTLHVHWSPEFIQGRWVWSMYFGGHVFDEIGTAAFGYGAENIDAWVEVDDHDVELSMDQQGNFIGRYIVGRHLNDSYEITLHARTLDNYHCYEVDEREERTLSIFPPWDKYLR